MTEPDKAILCFACMSFPIYEPVTDCTIIYRYYALGIDRKSTVEYNDRFKTVDQLKSYFDRIPGSGPLVGYGKRKPWHTWAQRAILIIEWTDKIGTCSVEFDDAKKFIEFVRERPALAKVLDVKS